MANKGYWTLNGCRRPLLLDWIKLRRPVQKPSELLELPNSELFDWDIVEPPRHSGFMYQALKSS